MKAFLVVTLVAALAACSRPVKVQTAPQPTSQVAVDVTNNADVAMNIDVVSGDNDIFLGQVSPNSTKLMPVSGITSGSVVTLKATTADGARTYRKEGVVLSGMYAWTVP